MSTLLNTWFTIQKTLFPWLEAELDPLTDKQRQFVEVVSLMAIDTASFITEILMHCFCSRSIAPLLSAGVIETSTP